jgi:hypothetical protein
MVERSSASNSGLDCSEPPELKDEVRASANKCWSKAPNTRNWRGQKDEAALAIEPNALHAYAVIFSRRENFYGSATRLQKHEHIA